MHIAHTETHAGMEIEIWHDETNREPHKEMECLAPMMTVSGNDGATVYGAKNEYNFEPLEWASEVEIMVNIHGIIEIMGLDTEEVFRDIRDRREANKHPFSFPCDFADTIRERWSNEESSPHYRSCLEKRAAMFNLFGIAAHVATSRGYCQGHWADVLIVHLPEWKQKCGTPDYDLSVEADRKAFERDAEGDLATWSAWAWGDVYGYTVTDPDGEQDDEHCGGFYGERGSDEWEYMLSQAREAAESMAKDRAAIAA